MLANVGGADIAGRHLKSIIGWSKNGNGVDLLGFNALPVGTCYYSVVYYDAGENAYFWSASEGYESDAYGLGLDYDYEDAYLGNGRKDNAS